MVGTERKISTIASQEKQVKSVQKPHGIPHIRTVAYDAKTKAEVLAAVGVTHSVRSAAKAFKVNPSTIQEWQKQAKESAQIRTDSALPPVAPISQGGGLESPPPPPVNQPTINQIRTATIANAVLADIAAIRAETRADLMKLRRLAIRRAEDSMLPMRRRKVTDQSTGQERVELDPTYTPPKVDMTAALYILNDVIGVNVGAAIEQVDEEPSAVEIHVVRDEVPENLQLPRPSAPTGTGA